MENAVIARESRLLENKSKEKLNSFRTIWRRQDSINYAVETFIFSFLSCAIPE
jgi:hypothetical protein